MRAPRTASLQARLAHASLKARGPLFLLAVLAAGAALALTPSDERILFKRRIITASHGSLLVTTTGAGSWTVPAGVTTILKMQCWGAGAAADGSASSAGSSGGGGAYAETDAIAVTPGQTIYYGVGTGGAGSTSVGAAGNPSWINKSANSQPANSSSSTIGCAAGGGSAPTTSTYGAGGSPLAYNGANYSGGFGANGSGTGAGGGGGAGSAGAGSAGAANGSGGAGGSPDGGAGGTGHNGSGVNGSAGSQPGGSGGGCWTSCTGGSGAAGQIKIVW